ncbi:ATP-binding protein [Woodsholea maritima]|uniref:ATP-binding protein n=1 Tax=Woodsholea maritima TaxID=240237 RepID=UPI000363815A|nr:ATP-binding protein [Woodsholea maritima]
MARTARVLIQDTPTIDPLTPGGHVYDLFSSDPDLLACAVVEDDRPLGMVSRNAFFLRMADLHGRALFGRRPITFVMEKNPLIIEADHPISELNRLIVTDRPSALFDGFIITKAGKYAGVATGVALMSVMQKESEERNRKLLALADQLGQARTEALAAAKSKSQFFAAVSHELRTPLNGVLGVSELLLDTQLDPDQQRLAETIHNSGEMLVHLLNDILDLSKMEANRMKLDERPFDPAHLVKSALDLWTARAAQKNLTYQVCGQGLDDQWLIGDSLRIKQVLFNLIANAIKFTKEGEVCVTLAVHDIGMGRRILRADVSDTGCGIPETAAKSLFRAYHQANSSGSSSQGTGLGLALCKRIMDLMGGKIDFTSHEGRGSTFWFEIPLEGVEQKPVGAPCDADTDEKAAGDAPAFMPHILLVEDDLISRDVVRGFIRRRGWQCDWVERGEDALEACQHQHFDLVIMDNSLPGISGVETLKALRASDSHNRDIPVIALSARAMHGDEERFKQVGMQGFIPKPIEINRFYSEIEGVLKHLASTARTQKSTRAA